MRIKYSYSFLHQVSQAFTFYYKKYTSGKEYTRKRRDMLSLLLEDRSHAVRFGFSI